MLDPLEYGSQKKYPLVVFLHGAGERGNDNKKQLTHGGSLFLKEDVRRAFPAIVIFPQCPTEDFWSSVKIQRSENGASFTFDYSSSEERRVGKKCFSTCRSRWSPNHSQKKQKKE